MLFKEEGGNFSEGRNGGARELHIVLRESKSEGTL